MQKRYLTYLIYALVFITGIFLISWPMFYNRYPLVYSDTGTYLRNSILLEQAPDRPIGYGFFIRLLSWQAMTRNVIIGQAIIIWLVTYRVCRLHLNKPLLVHFLILCVLAVASSLPWYASQLMPDIFSGAVVLTVYLLFFDTKSWKGVLAYGILLSLICSTHYSYLLLSGFSIGALAILKLRYMFTSQKKWLYKTALSFAFVFVSAFCIMMCNYNQTGRFKLNFASNVFLTAKFTDGDILNTYLRDNCGKKNIPFCSLKDSLTNPMAFIWSSELPFQKEFRSDWVKVNDKCAVIVSDVFTTPKYLKLFIAEAWHSTLRQLGENKIGSGLLQYYKFGTPGDIISEHFESEFPQFLGARQNHENFEDLRVSRYIDYIVLFSMIITIGGLLFRPIRKKAGYLLFICLAGVVFNAFITASMANVYDRLQARITWIVEFSALIVLILVAVHFYDRRKAVRNR